MSLTPHHLTDAELIAAITSLTGHARAATAALIAHLAELEARDLHRAQGYGSLFLYCRGVLHLSEHESYHRIEAARSARRFPVLLALLAEGRLHLTAVCLLAPHLKDEDHLALLGGAVHKSKAEVELLLARWFPRPDVRTSIRRAPGSRTSEGKGVADAALPTVDRPAAQTADATDSGEMAGRDGEQPTHAAQRKDAQQRTDVAQRTEGGEQTAEGGAPNPDDHRPLVASPKSAPAGATSASRRSRGAITPLSADGYDVRFRARAATVSRLRRAQELLSHAVPDGDVDEIVYRALGELIAHAEKRRHAGRPGAGHPGAGDTSAGGTSAGGTAARRSRGVAPASREISAAVQREVWARDGGQCAFIAKTGHRCEERRFLEFHHVKPWAASGPPTVSNISLRCRAHNDYEARRFFGPIREAMGFRAAMADAAAMGNGAVMANAAAMANGTRMQSSSNGGRAEAAATRSGPSCGPTPTSPG